MTDKTDKQDLKDLIIQGGKYKTKYTWKYENRVFWETPNPNHIYSFISGTIIDIFVKTNEKVKEGQTLLLLEAMKMQNQVRMPFDGQIVKIHVKRNDTIPRKQLMLEIKPVRIK